MNRYCFVLGVLLLLFPYQIKSQPDDAARFESLLNLAGQSSKTESERALECAEEALTIGERMKSPKMIAHAQKMLVTIYFDAQNFTKAIEYGNLCEPFFERSGDVESLSSLYNLLSNTYFYIGNAEMSDIYSDKSIELAEKHNVVDVLFKQYYNRAVIAYYRGDYSYSMEFAFKALNVANKNNLTSYTAYCYDLMGSLSNNLFEHRKAVNYFHLSLNIYLAVGDKMSAGQTYNNLAFTYGKIDRQDSARLCFYKALDFYMESESSEGLAVTYTALAGYYLSEEKLDSAQYFIEKSLGIALTSESTRDLFRSYNTAGNISFQRGDYPKAMEYQRKAMLWAQHYGNKEHESSAKLGISRNYAAMRRYDSAYHYLSQSFAIDDSLRRNDEFLKRAYAYAEHVVTEQLEKERRAEDLQRQLWRTIVILCVLVIVIMSIFIWSMSVRQKKIVSMNAELNKYKSDLEIALRDRTRELMLTEQQILNLSNNLPNGAIFRFAFASEREGKMLYVSSGWEELTGYPMNATENNALFFSRIHPDDSGELLNALAHAIQNRTILDKVYRYFKSDNDLRWFHIRAVAISGDDGLTYLDGYQVDETEQKHFEHELVLAKEKAEESDRLKSAFLANMSHEIRTPMNAIVGFSSLLANTPLPRQQQVSCLELIHDNCQNLMQLIDDIVDISKFEAGQMSLRMETLPLPEIMKAVRDHFVPVVAARYPEIELWFDEGLFNSQLMVHTDVFRLKQVFVNLIENALKFTQKGFVKCFLLSDRSDSLHFIIMDTGMGIAKEDMEIIFQNFHKIDHHTSGTGLGLSIVKKALTLMGGNIWVESEQNVGSKFHFTLPAGNTIIE